MFIAAESPLAITLCRSVTSDGHAPPGLTEVSSGVTKL